MNGVNGKRYQGLYRGKVLSNLDPDHLGRLTLEVSDVLGDEPSNWAMPCVPFGGSQSGVYVVPAEGSGVWVTFEYGDPDRPVWVGGWWGSQAEIPGPVLQTPPPAQCYVVQTTEQNALVISDAPGPTGGITLKTASGAMIAINETGITITNGQGATIVMNGPTVTINQGALVIT
jgi:uncharacterized protein involved in type VI secretion and phage assembly